MVVLKVLPMELRAKSTARLYEGTKNLAPQRPNGALRDFIHTLYSAHKVPASLTHVQRAVCRH